MKGGGMEGLDRPQFQIVGRVIQMIKVVCIPCHGAKSIQAIVANSEEWANIICTQCGGIGVHNADVLINPRVLFSDFLKKNPDISSDQASDGYGKFLLYKEGEVFGLFIPAREQPNEQHDPDTLKAEDEGEAPRGQFCGTKLGW